MLQECIRPCQCPAHVPRVHPGGSLQLRSGVTSLGDPDLHFGALFGRRGVPVLHMAEARHAGGNAFRSTPQPLRDGRRRRALGVMPLGETMARPALHTLPRSHAGLSPPVPSHIPLPTADWTSFPPSRPTHFPRPHRAPGISPPNPTPTQVRASEPCLGRGQTKTRRLARSLLVRRQPNA